MADIRNITFDQLAIYIAVVESGSLTRAADRLGIGKTAVSATIQRLEAEVGSGLLVRTTRKLSVTEAGQAFFEACKSMFSIAEEAVSAASGTDDISGTLRIGASVEFSAAFLAPVLAQMRQLHPKLKVELIAGDRFADLIEEGIDVAIRLGRLADSSYRAVEICQYSKLLMASPQFVAAHDIGDDVTAIALAPYIGLSVLARPLHASLVSERAEPVEIDFKDGFSANTVYACRAAAIAGAGMALLPDFTVIDDIEAGRLVRVLPGWATPPAPIHALLPPGKFTAPKSRMLIEMLKQYMSSYGSTAAKHRSAKAT